MEIYVLNKEFESVGIIDAFNSFIWTDRYDSYGDFELYLPMNIELFSFIQEDYYLWISTSEHCMIIEKITIDSNVEDGDFLTISGRSLESILDRRIVWGQKILSGGLQDCVETLLNECIISPTITDRKITNFRFEPSTDPSITALQLDVQYNGDNLYDVINTICTKSGIGFKMVLDDYNNIVFSLYKGVDRSYIQNENPYVVFSSEFDNLLNSNFFHSKAEFKNVAYVAGEGEGKSQKNTSVSIGSFAGIDRREIYVDASGISSDTEDGELTAEEYTSQLAEKGKEELSTHLCQTAFEGELEPNTMYVYGKDYNIGDIVQVADNYGNERTVYISEIVTSQDENGTLIYPTFKSLEEEGN